MATRLSAWLLALGLSACVAPPGPMERLSNAAHDLNSATRFARMDVAISLVDIEQQSEFASRHATWHRDLRIVDLELNGIQLIEAGEAEVSLAVMWHHFHETDVRVTSISQLWKQTGEDWRLVEEQPVGGASGLFAHPKKKKRPKKPAAEGKAEPSPAPSPKG